jgi:hypothetical protein
MNSVVTRNDAQPHDPALPFLRGRGILSLWFGVLAGPVAALVCLEVAYMAVPWACRTHAVLPLHLVPLLTGLLALAAGLVARRDWRATERGWPDDSEGVLSRSRFMAALGVGLSAFSLLVIIGQWMAILFLDPCALT